MITTSDIPVFTLFFLLTLNVYNDRIRREGALRNRIEKEAAIRESTAITFEKLRPHLEEFVKKDNAGQFKPAGQWKPVGELLDILNRFEREGRWLQIIFGGVLLLIVYVLAVR